MVFILTTLSIAAPQAARADVSQRAVHSSSSIIPPPGTWITPRQNYRRTNRVDNGSASIITPALKWSYPLGGAPNARLADITGPGAGLPDGTPELVVWGGGRVRAYNIQLTPPQLLWQSDIIPGLGDFMPAGDLDGNGTVELIFDAACGAQVLGGRTGEALTCIPGVAVRRSRIADANNDGKMELFVEGGPRIYTFAGGAANPQLVASFNHTDPSDGYMPPTLADLDNDGDLDVVSYTSHGTNQLRTLQQTSPLSWTLVSTLTLSNLFYAYAFPILADVAPQSGLEVVLHNSYGTLYVANIAPSNLALTLVYTQPSFYSGDVPMTVQAADVDPGTPGREIVLSSYYATTVEVRRGDNGNALFSQPLNMKEASRVTSYTPPAPLPQLDADSEREVVLVGGGQVAVYQGGTFTATHVITSASPAAPYRHPHYLPYFDVDGDGVDELLVGRSLPAGDRLAAYSVSGTLTLKGEYIFPVGQNLLLRDFGQTPFGRGLVLSGSDGYVYLLDATFNVRKRVYAGSASASPLVLDTDNNNNNEVILGTTNLDPLTATLATPPRVNYTGLSTSGWGPTGALVPLGGGTWGHLVIGGSAPSYTLGLLYKSPSTGAEMLIASGLLTTTASSNYAIFLGAGVVSNTTTLFFVEVAPGNYAINLRAVQRQGSTFSPIWIVTVAGGYDLTIIGGASIADINGDGHDDIVYSRGADTWIFDGPTGGAATFPGGVNGHYLALIDDFYSAAAGQEVVLAAPFAHSTMRGYTFTIATLTPNPAWGATLPSGYDTRAAVAAVTPSDGRDVVRTWSDGRVVAYEGVSGAPVYTMSLGVAVNLSTCEENPRIPQVYSETARTALTSACPGKGRFYALGVATVANVDGESKDELLVPSGNGYLYVLNAEDGSLTWAHNFFAPVASVIAANVDGDPDLEILVSPTDGYLYALDQATFTAPLAVWEGLAPNASGDLDEQASTQCLAATWSVVNDPNFGAPSGFAVAIRDSTGALVSNGYLNVPYSSGSVASVTACYNDPNPNRRLISNLIPGRSYFVEVINYYISGSTYRSSQAAFSDGVKVVPLADFATSAKFATPTAINTSGTVTWTVVVRNSSAYSGTAQLLDPIPPFMTFTSGSLNATSGSATYNSALSRVEWIGSLDALEVATITFQTTANPLFVDSVIRNEAQVINVKSGYVHTLEAAVAVGNAPNLSTASKLVSANTANQLDVITYTLQVTNSGAVAVSGLLVDDLLPAEVSFVPGSLSANGGSGSATYDPVLRRVQWNGTLNAGQSLVVKFRARVNAANAVIVNCAAFSDGFAPHYRRCAETRVGSSLPTLQVTKTSDRLRYASGDLITYTILLENRGSQPAQVTLNDPLPGGVTLNSATAFPPEAGALNIAGSNVAWQGTVPPGEYVAIVISGTLSANNTVLTNRAFITETTTNTALEAVREVVVGNAPLLRGEKIAQPGAAGVGQPVTYTIRLFNLGTVATSSALITDPLPAGTAFDSYVIASNGIATFSSGQLTWNGSVGLVDPTVIVWRVKVNNSAMPGSVIVNQAFASDGSRNYGPFEARTSVPLASNTALIQAKVYTGTATTPLAGVVVTASSPLGQVNGTSDSNGMVYLPVPASSTPANYLVEIEVPAGLVAISPRQVGVANLTVGQVRDVTFRVAAPAPPGNAWVWGVTYHDTNGDGYRDLFGEPGVNGVLVQADSGQSTFTGADGSYALLVPAGLRSIIQTAPIGWIATTPNPAVVNALSQGAHEVNFGLRQIRGDDGENIEPPPPGLFRIVGYVYADADGALNAPNGHKDASDTGLSNITVTMRSGPTVIATVSSNAAGLYQADVGAGASLVVEVTPPPGYIPLTPRLVAVTGSGAQIRRVDFGLISQSALAAQCGGSSFGILNGYVYSDTLKDGKLVIGLDEPTTMLANVSVATQTLQTNWLYAFSCVPAGGQVVTATNPLGYYATTPIAVSVNVPAGDSTGANFGKATSTYAPQHAFSKTAPLHLSTNVTKFASLSWTPSPSATGYFVCVGTAQNLCNATGGWVAVGNVTNWTVAPVLQSASTYWWQVRAFGPGFDVQADAEQWWSFTTINDMPPAPEAFSKREPNNGAVNQATTNLKLEWNASAGATKYEICLGTAINSCNVTGNWIEVVPNPTPTSWQPPTLLPATTYWWQVRAVNSNGQAQANNGQWWYFTTRSASDANAPAPFWKAAPVDAAANQPLSLTLSWTAAGGATSYEVCVGIMPADCSATGGDWVDVGNATSYALSGLSHGTTYFWQARAVNNNGVTLADNGNWWSFTTGNSPAAIAANLFVTKTAPIHLATNVATDTATLSWSASTSAVFYVCLGTNVGLCDVSGGWVKVGNATSWTVVPPLQSAATYWWQVRAITGSLNVQADAGQWWSFSTLNDPSPGPGGFNKASPSYGDINQPVTLTLSWGGASGAMGYEVCIGTQINLCDVTGNWIKIGNVTSWPVTPALQPAATYWWQVRAVNSNGQTQADNGQWWYFTTAAISSMSAPGAFSKVAPPNNTPNRPLALPLSWTAASGATGYKVCVGITPADCSATGGRWVHTTTTSYALSGLRYGVTYFWQVHAVNNAGDVTPADDGAWWSFSTVSSPYRTFIPIVRKKP